MQPKEEKEYFDGYFTYLKKCLAEAELLYQNREYKKAKYKLGSLNSRSNQLVEKLNVLQFGIGTGRHILTATTDEIGKLKIINDKFSQIADSISTEYKKIKKQLKAMTANNGWN